MAYQAGTPFLHTGTTGAYQTWQALTPSLVQLPTSMRLLGLQPPMDLTTGVGEWPWIAGTLTNLWGSTVVAPGLIPADCWLLGVTVEVLSDLNGVTGFDVGEAGNLQRFGTNIAPTVGSATTLANHNILAIPASRNPTDIVLTALGGTFSGGSIRIRVHYATLTQGYRGEPWLTATTTLSTIFGATVTAPTLIPDDAWIIGVQTLVTSPVTGALSFDIEDEHGVAHWGYAIPTAQGTQTQIRDFLSTTWSHYTEPTNVVVRARDGSFTNGTIQLTVYYADLSLPWLTRSTTLTSLSGAAVPATNLLHSGEWVIGVTIEVVDPITGPIGINVGDEIAPTLWGEDIAVETGENYWQSEHWNGSWWAQQWWAIAVADGIQTDISDFLVTTPTRYLTPTDVVLRPVGSDFSGGDVAVTAYVAGLGLFVDFSAVVSATTTVSGAISITSAIGLAATVASSSTVAAQVEATRPITSLIAVSVAVTAALSTTRPIASVVASSSTLTAAIQATRPLVSTVDAISTVSSDLTVVAAAQVPFASIISTSSTVSSLLTTTRPLSSAIASVSTVAVGAVQIERGLASVLEASATVVGGIIRQRRLGAELNVFATLDAALSIESKLLLASVIEAVSTVSPHIRATRPLSSVISAVSLVTPNLNAATIPVLVMLQLPPRPTTLILPPRALTLELTDIVVNLELEAISDNPDVVLELPART